MARELTREEKRAIRALVTKWCANYDRECGCLPLDCECYMLGKCWTGAYCRYFREAVLPLDPALEVSLLSEGPRPDFKPCPICGGAVPADGRMAYCSESCARIALRRQKRDYMRKMALNGYVLHVDLSPVQELVSLQRRCSNNLNQVAIQANTYGGIYPEEIKALQRDYEKLWRPLSDLLEKLSAIVRL